MLQASPRMRSLKQSYSESQGEEWWLPRVGEGEGEELSIKGHKVSVKQDENF